MAKKTTKISMNTVIRVCSYFALVLAAAIFLFNGVVQTLGITLFVPLIALFNLIGQICLVIGIAFPAYDFTVGKKKGWRIVFWVALFVYVFACVFGVIKF